MVWLHSKKRYSELTCVYMEIKRNILFFQFCFVGLYHGIIENYVSFPLSLSSLNLPDGCHGNEGPPKTFPWASKKRAREFSHICSSVLGRILQQSQNLVGANLGMSASVVILLNIIIKYYCQQIVSRPVTNVFRTNNGNWVNWSYSFLCIHE